VDIVRVQEALIAAADANIYLFDTDDLPMQSDNIHFAPAGHIAIGNAIYALITGTANQQPTQIASGQSFSLRAASGPGTVVGTVALTQTGSPTPTFAVAGSALEIDGFTGKIRVKDLSGITQSQLQVSVSALNGVAPTAQTTVTLNFTVDPPGIQGLFATFDPNSSSCSLVSGCYQEIFDAANSTEKYTAPGTAQRPVAASFPGASARAMTFDTTRILTGVNGNTLLAPAVDEDLTIAAAINIPVHNLSTTAWIATLNKDATSVASGIGYDYAQNKFFAGYANGINGTNEILTSTQVIVPGSSHVVRLRKVGNTVRLFIDGVLAGQVSGATVRPAIFVAGEGAAPVVFGGLFAPAPQFKGSLGKTYFVKGIPTTTEESQMDSDLASWMGTTVSPPPPPPTSWTLNVNSGSGSGAYTAGTVVPVNANAAPSGSQFSAWTGDTVNLANASAASTNLTMPNAAATLTATYTVTPISIPTWTLSVSHGTGSGSYTSGSTVSVVADTPPFGSQFAGWTGDTSGLANPLAASTTLVMPNAAAALTATYSVIPVPAPTLWTLSVSHGTGSGSYTSGSTVSVVADAPPSGSQFAGWSGDTSSLANSLAASTTLVMPNAAAALTATYMPIPLSAPTNLSAQRVASNRAWLFWNDNTPNETGYQIEWKSGSGPFVLVATVGPNSTAYYHNASTMASNIVYTYRVRAISTAAASGYSNEAQVKIGTTGGSALQYLLTVNGGSGGGLYNATTLVPISAAAPAAGQVFTGWTGTTAVLANPHAASTTAKMPARPLSLTATYGPPTPYQQWKLTYLGSFTVADTAIPDNDGVPALLKYATAMVPGTPSPAGPATLDSFNNVLTLQFKRLSPAPIDYVVEASTDLINWSAITHLATGSNTWTGKAKVSETASGSPRITTVRDIATMATGPHRFLRLRVGTGVAGTIPQGYIKITISAQSTSTVSVPLDDAPIARGAVQAVTPSTITTTTAGAWDNAAAPYALRLMSGKAAGATFPITAVNGTTLSLNTSEVDLTRLVAAGDSYVVFPVDTLGTLFGTTKVLFKTGATAATADNLQLRINGEWVTFFHNGNAWYNASDLSVSQNNVLLSTDTGLLVLRRSSPALVFTVLGRVHEVSPRQFVPNGSTLLANPQPIDVKLASTGFRAASGWITGPSPTTTDTLQAWNGKSWLTFFHNGTTWRKAGSSASMDNYLLPAGQAVFVTRLSAPPRDQMFILQPLPYSP
ncbi:MAG: hypothetical protein JF599_13500, partial [Verrucomicrobia bacterium]|nr:hypothetical protein [Verrucomicrobiota bacterium]